MVLQACPAAVVQTVTVDAPAAATKAATKPAGKAAKPAGKAAKPAGGAAGDAAGGATGGASQSMYLAANKHIRHN